MTREEMAKAIDYLLDNKGLVPYGSLRNASTELRKTCEWDSDDDGNWHTACGNIHILLHGGPTFNDMQFCCYCGGSVHEVEPEP